MTSITRIDAIDTVSRATAPPPVHPAIAPTRDGMTPTPQRPDIVDTIPAAPPPELYAEMDRAFARADQLEDQGRELRFTSDPHTGRVVIEVRDLDGDVLRTIPPSEMLDILGGAAV